jgi:hypothetical protein
MTRKLDKEHLEEIQNIRDEFAKNSSVLGNIVIEEHILTQQLQQLQQEKSKYVARFEQLQQHESELIEKMRERYGDGQINIADGTFTAD